MHMTTQTIMECIQAQANLSSLNHVLKSYDPIYNKHLAISLIHCVGNNVLLPILNNISTFKIT